MRFVSRLSAAFVLTALLTNLQAEPRLQLELDREFYLEKAQNNFYLKTTIHTGDPNSAAATPPTNIVFLVDRSGSMEGEKLGELKQALKTALSSLSSDDRVALVAFGSSIETLIPSTPVDQLQSANATIENLSTDGGSALYGGIEEAFYEIQKNATAKSLNRIILITDGPPNKGPREMTQFVELAKTIAAQKVSIAAFALGTDAPRELLTHIASQSSAALHEIEDISSLAGKLSAELQAFNKVIGEKATLEVRLPAYIDIVESIGHQAEQSSRGMTFHIDNLLANQEIATVVQGTINASASRFARTKIATVTLTYYPAGAERGEPVVIEEKIDTRFVQTYDVSLRSIVPHVYQTVCEYEVADAIREASDYLIEGRSKKALRDLRKLSRDIRAVARNIPELQVQASLDQLNKTIDSIEYANQSPIEQRAITETLFPTQPSSAKPQ